MSSIFNVDNKFFHGVGKIVDGFYLNILWLICSIPIITIGASTTALYYTTHKVLRGGRGYVGKSFFSSFKQNFKQSTLIWLIFLILGVICILDTYIMYQMLVNGSSLGIFYYIFLIIGVILIFMVCTIFPYIARFENTTKQVLKNSVFIMVANFPKILICSVFLLIEVLLIYLLPILIIIMPVLITICMDLFLEKVFRKYMSLEDLEREKELDM